MREKLANHADKHLAPRVRTSVRYEAKCPCNAVSATLGDGARECGGNSLRECEKRGCHLDSHDSECTHEDGCRRAGATARAPRPDVRVARVVRGSARAACSLRMRRDESRSQSSSLWVDRTTRRRAARDRATRGESSRRNGRTRGRPFVEHRRRYPQRRRIDNAARVLES